jgi:hypothetical protein
MIETFITAKGEGRKHKRRVYKRERLREAKASTEIGWDSQAQASRVID